ncbi:hypothetical protein J1N35_036167 [Gossypium stocksii]|uniref:CBS domain-containing protein n=1 Tax=Gossypium stocksii TaxID=47602 RepID=A0A9D3UHJ6_9ROSI|nr:hypothetical protein J1N35_036167 [Gossypium stocksii]
MDELMNACWDPIKYVKRKNLTTLVHAKGVFLGSIWREGGSWRVTGRVCMAISAKWMAITGIDDRRYWNWVSTEESKVPAFEQRIDNIVGIAYAMDLLDYVPKGELLESTTVEDMTHKPAYFVPNSMSVWNLLREFRIRKVHMVVVLNEYGVTVGVISPQSASGVVLDAPEATKLLSAVSIALANCSRVVDDGGRVGGGRH